jgi:tRNA-dihydrouridine synthase
MMELYLAPMEGITGYIYRNALKDLFGDHFRKYFTAFITPRPKAGMRSKERNDMHPDNNKGITLVPQIMSRDAEEFLSLAHEIRADFGYEEINLNCGCPSGTVVSHGRGSGMLKDPEYLDRFLFEVFEKTEVKISVKTRIGVTDPDEWSQLLEIYKKYPLSELIIHPRVQKQGYGGKIWKECFEMAADAPFRVIYNGDIKTTEDLKCLSDTLMIGRGVIADPSLGRQIYGGVKASAEELKAFHDRIFSEYEALFDGPQPLISHMKELWSYMCINFPGKEKEFKALKKARNLAEYKAAIRGVFYAAV